MSDNTYPSNTPSRDYKTQFQKKAENAARRASLMDIKVFQLKIQSNHLNQTQKQFLNNIFLEAKWYYNSCIAFGKIEGNKPYKNDCKAKTVTHYDKDKNPIISEYTCLGAASRQDINKQIGIACKSIKSNLKAGNIKHTKGLSFVSEVNSVSFRQFGNSWKFNGTKIKLAGLKKPLKVFGLEQLNIEGIEFANAYLVQRPTGWYVHVTCYVPKQEHKHNYQTVAADFGCETSFTTYIEETNQSRKLNYCFEQSENEKRTQRKLSRRMSKKFSNRTNKGLRLIKKLRKQKQRRSDRKKDAANKLVFWFKQFETVVIQDEMLSNWQRSGHGKKIEQGILGCVKARLKTLSNVFVLDRSLPTSKYCFDCFHKNENLKVWDREFICPNCGCISDRDVHAAQNMIAFYKLIMMVPTEYRDLKRIKLLLIDIEKRVENNSSESIEESVFNCIQELSEKHEATDALASW